MKLVDRESYTGGNSMIRRPARMAMLSVRALLCFAVIVTSMAVGAGVASAGSSSAASGQHAAEVCLPVTEGRTNAFRLERGVWVQAVLIGNCTGGDVVAQAFAGTADWTWVWGATQKAEWIAVPTSAIFILPSSSIPVLTHPAANWRGAVEAYSDTATFVTAWKSTPRGWIRTTIRVSGSDLDAAPFTAGWHWVSGATGIDGWVAVRSSDLIVLPEE